ncbi:MAG: hypothetical protein ACLQVI_01735 [Polyangiaceae bacterium]|jgi:hypothetical protein
MDEPGPKYRSGRSLAAKVGAGGLGYLALLYLGVPLQRQADRLHEWWWKGYEWLYEGTRKWPPGAIPRAMVHRLIDLLGHGFMQFFSAAYVTVFAAAVVLGPLGLLGRMVATARVRTGAADPIEPVRRWIAAHPSWFRVLTVVPPALWAVYTEIHGLGDWGGRRDLGSEYVGFVGAYGIVGVFATIALTGLLRSAVRSFVAPVVDESVPQRAEVAKDEITFDAVAVTRETRAAVGAMLALNIGALAVALSSHRVFSDPSVLAGLVAYSAVALGGAALFRHASQVAIGVDGVLVKGTSRTRFFAYRDLDAARVEGGDLLLVRRDRVVLRLQLHGEDASKRDAVLARIREAIDRVKEGRGAVSAQLVSSATSEQLARAAGGGADYRGASLTREQLWALVEGPEIESSARRVAAEALARTSDEADRARLRVAAEHCAAPEVRVALGRLAEGETLEEERRADAVLARRSA